MNSQFYSQSKMEARVEVQELPLSDDDSPPTFYLDIIPVELFDHILRFFSRIPNADVWENHIPLQLLVELYRVQGEFASFLSNRFKTLCVSGTIDCLRENRLWKWKLRKERMLYTDDIEVAFQFVFTGGGQALETLIIGIGMFNEKYHGTLIADDFFRRCPNVTSLSICNSPPTWLSKFGFQLEKLECWNHSAFDISVHCRNLRELTLGASFLDFGCTNAWVQNAETLESLSISLFGKWPKHIRYIQKYCRNLRRISIRAKTKEGKSAVSKLIASYGDQLLWADVPNFDESQWNHVVSSCTKARFCVKYKEFLAVSRMLHIVGHQLEKIVIPLIPENALELTNGWNKCINLHELVITRCSFEHIRAIFNTPKPHLKRIELYVDGDGDSTENEIAEIIELLSKSTDEVEKLYIDCRGVVWNQFIKLFEIKKSKLSTVGLPYRYSSEKLNELMDILLKKSPLKELLCLNEPSADIKTDLLF